MPQSAKTEPWVKFVGRVAPQVKNPCIIHLTAYVAGERIHADLVDPIRADRRRAYLDAFYDALGRHAVAAAGVAERTALDQEILNVARATIPAGLLDAWRDVGGPALPVVSRPRNGQAADEVDDEGSAGDRADDDSAYVPGDVEAVAPQVAGSANQPPPSEAGAIPGAVPVPGAGAGVEKDKKPARPRWEVIGVVKPGLFFTPWVSGLAVERRFVPLDANRLRPRLYLQWADGLREAVTLWPKLILPDGRALRLTPDCWNSGGSEGYAGEQGVWPEKAPRAWLGEPPPPPPGAPPEALPEASQEASQEAPWAPDPEPLDVFQRLVGLITEFVDLAPAVKAEGTERTAGTATPADSPAAATLAIWTLLTYCYPVWNAVPYLAVLGPPESGKTTLLGVLARLCYRPLGTSIAALTPTVALFGALKRGVATLLVDQADALRQGSAHLREAQNILLQGTRRGGTATQVNGKRRQEVIDVFGPKALACVGGLAPALAGRCITVRSRPAPHTSECPGRTIDANDPRWGELTGDLHALALTDGQTWPLLARRPWKSMVTEVQPPMGWRQQEVWQPILALAAWLEENGAEGLLAKMVGYAQACNAAADQERMPEVDEVLLRALARLVLDGESPTCAEVLAEAWDEEPAVARVLHGSPRAVAVVLGRYGLVSTRAKDRRFRLTMQDMRRVEEAYGVDLEICGATAEICGAL